MEFDKQAVGQAIRRLRKERGLSQEVVSSFASLARSHLAMIENGDKQPNFETIWRLANAFGLYPHELVKLIEEERLRSTS
ncbi:MAG: helix-turn-helix domain-containing protein [Christensenellales bacterium]